MKKILKLCAAGAVIIAAAVACNNKSAKVTAAVAGPEAAPVALVVEYDNHIAPDAVTPETFAVPGYEIACVKVTDKNPAAKPECKEGAGPKGPKPECCGEGDPKGPKPECCGEGDPKGPKPECCGEGDPKGPKPECCGEEGPKGPKPECAAEAGKYVVILLKGDKPCCEEGPKGPKPECVGEEGPKCDKPCCEEGPKCDKPCCEEGNKPECCGEGDPKPECCEELPVPEIAVQQVADIVTADGKVVKAWKKAVNATAAVPFITKHGRHGAPGPKPGEPGCCKEEAPAAE